MTIHRGIRLDEVLGQPGLSRAAANALVELQPKTVRQAIRIHGIGRKTAYRLLELGLLTDPEDLRNRALTTEDLRRQ